MDDYETIPSNLPGEYSPAKPEQKAHPILKILLVAILLLVAFWVFKR
jgi:hypothetical protein